MVRTSISLFLLLATALALCAAAKRTGRENLTVLVEELRSGRHSECLREEAGPLLEDAEWLLNRLNSTKWEVSEAYKESLARAVEALAAPQAACEVVRTVYSDVKVKAADCRKFGHGRDVPVLVHTRKDGTDARGWQVFARWTNGRLLGGDKPLRNLSSPARGELPPGEYVLQARKGGQKSESLRFTVGGSQTFECEIPVP